MIELQTFGHAGLTSGEGGDANALLAQPKRCSLFCYLALPKPGTLHRRDTLLGVFWPESDQEHARMDLPQALRFIRRPRSSATRRIRVNVRAGSFVERLESTRAVALPAVRSDTNAAPHVRTVPGFSSPEFSLSLGIVVGG